MTPDEIQKLLEEHKKYNFPDVILKRELALALVNSGDPMFLLNIPEPFRAEIINFGLSLNDHWYEISNNGTLDLSVHVKPLKVLVKRFVAEVPVGKYIHWKSPST